MHIDNCKQTNKLSNENVYFKFIDNVYRNIVDWSKIIKNKISKMMKIYKNKIQHNKILCRL